MYTCIFQNENCPMIYRILDEVFDKLIHLHKRPYDFFYLFFHIKLRDNNVFSFLFLFVIPFFFK